MDLRSEPILRGPFVLAAKEVEEPPTPEALSERIRLSSSILPAALNCCNFTE